MIVLAYRYCTPSLSTVTLKVRLPLAHSEMMISSKTMIPFALSRPWSGRLSFGVVASKRTSRVDDPLPSPSFCREAPSCHKKSTVRKYYRLALLLDRGPPSLSWHRPLVAAGFCDERPSTLSSLSPQKSMARQILGRLCARWNRRLASCSWSLGRTHHQQLLWTRDYHLWAKKGSGSHRSSLRADFADSKNELGRSDEPFQEPLRSGRMPPAGRYDGTT